MQIATFLLSELRIRLLVGGYFLSKSDLLWLYLIPSISNNTAATVLQWQQT